MTKVRIQVEARVKYTKVISFKSDEEAEEFVGATDDTILCNIDESEDIDEIDNFEVIDVCKLS